MKITNWDFDSWPLNRGWPLNRWPQINLKGFLIPVGDVLDAGPRWIPAFEMNGYPVEIKFSEK